MKTNETSVREQALAWWNRMSFEEKFYKVIPWLKDNGRDTTERHPNSLTGREIEEVWLKELEKKQLAIDLTDYINKKKNQDECIGFIDGYKKANEKQFKQGNDNLFKAYINKFSQEYKARMLQILIDDLGVRALVDKSLRS